MVTKSISATVNQNPEILVSSPEESQPFSPDNLLYEDPQIVVINKPPGCHSTDLPGRPSDSVAAWLRNYDPCFAQAGPSPEEGGLVQRLDYHTTGCLLAAKNPSVYAILREAVQRGSVNKTYLALLVGQLEQRQIIDSYIGTPYRRARKVKVYRSEPPARCRALPAHTEIEPLQYITLLDATIAKVSASPARRHQIRAHCALIGHPLRGDSLYNQIAEKPQLSASETLPEFLLHAAELTLKHPLSDKELTLAAPLPNYWPTPGRRA